MPVRKKTPCKSQDDSQSSCMFHWHAVLYPQRQRRDKNGHFSMQGKWNLTQSYYCLYGK